METETKKEKFLRATEELHSRVVSAALKWKTIGFSFSKFEYFYVDSSKNEQEENNTREIEIIHNETQKPN